MLNLILLITSQMIESRFEKLVDHSLLNLKKKWMFGILDDFITKQLPHNVTWGLSLLYALDHQGDRAMTSTQGSDCHLEFNCKTKLILLSLSP